MTILIAEDDLISRVQLERALMSWGHDIVSATTGQEAWNILKSENSPRIAVLDWRMPCYTGPELCKMVRENSQARYTYLLLLTGMDARESVRQGLEAGADDYVTKPFDLTELRHRIKAGERIIRDEALITGKNLELQRYAAAMEQLAEERAQQLIHTARMATIGQLAGGIAHEINNPATYITGNTQMLKRLWKDYAEPIDEFVASRKNDGETIRRIIDDVPDILDEVQDGVMRITQIVNGLKHLAHRPGAAAREFCAIEDCIDEALTMCHNQLKYNVTVETEFEGELPRMHVVPGDVQRVIVNLILNAVEAMTGRNDALLTIRCMSARKKEVLLIDVEDTGSGIPETILNRVFEPFVTTRDVGTGAGLGLTICRRIVEEYDGNIAAFNRESAGARIAVTWPVGRRSG